MKRYYLAYGSNLDIWQMSLRCPTAVRVGTGEIKDYELLFKGSKTGSYLTIEPKEGATVPVGVYTVTADDEKALDRYEGYPRFYYKKKLELPILDERKHTERMVHAFVYIMHEKRPAGIPTHRYMDTCTRGYEHFGFDKKILRDAERRAWEALGWQETAK